MVRATPLLAPLGFVASALLFAATLTGCPKSYPHCDNDATCKKFNEVCVDGQCKQCSTDNHCQAIDACMTCQANACVRTPGCCKSNLDCPDGRCSRAPGASSGTCVAGCEASSDCPAGQKCTNGACVPDVECSDDSACPTGQRCDGTRCVAGCTVETVYFDFNESAIRLDQESAVSRNAACLKSNGSRVSLEGHCDDRGSDEYNMALGQRRANSVAKQYKALGVGEGQITGVISYGEERGVCTDADEGCWSRNRRVESVSK
jgi:peptidoglycan-associated lipoprotein